MSNEETKKKFIHASVSAKVLFALTPLLKQASELAHSDFAFINQMSTEHFGCYLLPAEKGIAVVVVENAALLAIRDEEGQVSEPLRVTFPNQMLEALAPRMVTLFNENGIPFEVESAPKAVRVLCSDGFGMVFPDKNQSEKLEGCLGTWFNGDHDNFIDEGSYRAARVDAEFISKVVSRTIAQASEVSTVALNPWLLGPIAEAAQRMGTAIECTLSGDSDPVSIRSADDSMFGLLMPMKRDERGPAPLIEILTGKKAASA